MTSKHKVNDIMVLTYCAQLLYGSCAMCVGFLYHSNIKDNILILYLCRCDFKFLLLCNVNDCVFMASFWGNTLAQLWPYLFKLLFRIPCSNFR